MRFFLFFYKFTIEKTVGKSKNEGRNDLAKTDEEKRTSKSPFLTMNVEIRLVVVIISNFGCSKACLVYFRRGSGVRDLPFFHFNGKPKPVDTCGDDGKEGPFDHVEDQVYGVCVEGQSLTADDRMFGLPLDQKDACPASTDDGEENDCRDTDSEHGRIGCFFVNYTVERTQRVCNTHACASEQHEHENRKERDADESEQATVPEGLRADYDFLTFVFFCHFFDLLYISPFRKNMTINFVGFIIQ